MKKFLSVFLGACAIALFSVLPFSACKSKDGLTTLRINEVTHSVFYAPLYVADALGYFQDEGIKIDLTNGGGADNVMAAVLSGDAEIGFCGPEAALYVAAGGSTDVPTVFGQLTKRDGSFLVSRKAEPNFSWSNLEGKEILAGRKGGVPAMTFEYILKEKKVEANLNYDVAFNLMTSAFEAGTADYCTMFEPVASEYQKAGKGYIVAAVGEASGEVPYTCFLAKTSWLKKNEAIVGNFLRAVTKATKYCYETDASVIAEKLVAYFDGTEKSSLQTSVENYAKVDAWAKNMSMTEASYLRLEDIIERAGELPDRVDFARLVRVDLSQKAYDAVY